MNTWLLHSDMESLTGVFSIHTVHFEIHKSKYKYKYKHKPWSTWPQYFGRASLTGVFLHLCFIHTVNVIEFFMFHFCLRFQAGKVLMLLAITSWVAFTLPIGFIHPPVVRYFLSGVQVVFFG